MTGPTWKALYWKISVCVGGAGRAGARWARLRAMEPDGPTRQPDAGERRGLLGGVVGSLESGRNYMSLGCEGRGGVCGAVHHARRPAAHSLIQVACAGLRCTARLMFARRAPALSDERQTTSLPHLLNWLGGYLYICHLFTLSPRFSLLIDPYQSKLAETDWKSF